MIDGFKPSQRKVIHISSQIWKTGNEKALKIFQLAGKVASDAFHHHGNTSLEGAIITTMAQI
jgi:DNA gyrase/topoisomerase IV subunit A